MRSVEIRLLGDIVTKLELCHIWGSKRECISSRVFQTAFVYWFSTHTCCRSLTWRRRLRGTCRRDGGCARTGASSTPVSTPAPSPPKVRQETSFKKKSSCSKVLFSDKGVESALKSRHLSSRRVVCWGVVCWGGLGRAFPCQRRRHNDSDWPLRLLNREAQKRQDVYLALSLSNCNDVSDRTPNCLVFFGDHLLPGGKVNFVLLHL